MHDEIRSDDLSVTTLGPCNVRSPLNLSTVIGDGVGDFVSDRARIPYHLQISEGGPELDRSLVFEKAGPRERLFFDPPSTTAGIVTCGGLCPGMNNVIHSVYFELTRNYRIPNVLGFQHGYRGLNPSFGLEPIRLNDHTVETIHKHGGTVLGTSRGNQDPTVMVDCLQQHSIDVLFCIGGDGTQRGAHAIAQECHSRQLPIAVVGIPKTIDNDIPLVDRSFGYVTALEESQQVLRCAHVEARSSVNGVALVKLMGRHAGFIAAGAALASQEADFVLVPEVPFWLEGEDGFLAALADCVRQTGHAVVVVAEGAGQDLMPEGERERDPSGNLKPGNIGTFLQKQIKQYFGECGIALSLKYFDPSYSIRSVPANCADRLLCDQFARHAVHAAMSGKTDILVGLRHGAFVHVPLPVVSRGTKRMDIEGDRWTSVLLVTGQPRWTHERGRTQEFPSRNTNRA